ncbi:MAG: hypothetical protein ABI207_09685, partial [Crocinitomicaceae bacterium]
EQDLYNALNNTRLKEKLQESSSYNDNKYSKSIFHLFFYLLEQSFRLANQREKFVPFIIAITDTPFEMNTAIGPRSFETAILKNSKENPVFQKPLKSKKKSN